MNNQNNVSPSTAEALIYWHDIKFSASSTAIDREPPDHQSTILASFANGTRFATGTPVY